MMKEKKKTDKIPEGKFLEMVVVAYPSDPGNGKETRFHKEKR